MTYTTLISTDDLASNAGFAIVDCRFDLAKPDWGEADYRAAHVPGAVYAHLDRDLSGPKNGRNGRHPLPDVNAFKAQLGRWGIAAGVQVVVYDQLDGMFAARLWWMLRALGHEAVAVLDGEFRGHAAAMAGIERSARVARAAGQRRPKLGEQL